MKKTEKNALAQVIESAVHASVKGLIQRVSDLEASAKDQGAAIKFLLPRVDSVEQALRGDPKKVWQQLSAQAHDLLSTYGSYCQFVSQLKEQVDKLEHTVGLAALDAAQAKSQVTRLLPAPTQREKQCPLRLK